MNANENFNETEPIKPAGTPPDVEPAATEPATEEAAPVAKRTFRERLAGLGQGLRGTRGLIAATLAALIVGGFGGAAIHAAVDGHDRDGDRGGDFQRGDRFGGEQGDFARAPRGVPGQAPGQVPGEMPSEAPSDSVNS